MKDIDEIKSEQKKMISNGKYKQDDNFDKYNKGESPITDEGTNKSINTSKSINKLLIISEKRADEETSSEEDDGNVNLDDIEIEETLKK